MLTIITILERMKNTTTIIHNSNTAEYVIKLTKRTFPWWILLFLLLPLLLLIPVTQDVTYSISDKISGNLIENAKVNILYNYSDEDIEKEDFTTNEGIASFSIEGYRVYHLLFGRDGSFEIEAHVSLDCYNKTSYTKNSEYLIKNSPTSVEISMDGQEVEIHVVNKDNTNLHIPEATVIVNIEMPDASINTFDVKTDHNGIVKLALSDCGQISLIANKTGYESDSISKTTVSDLLSDNTKNRLKLKAITSQPEVGCRAFFAGTLISDEQMTGHISEVYVVDKYSEYVGAGEYPDNSVAFPKAVKTTFDGIAVDQGTRVVIYSKKNFQGSVLLDVTGPAVINNVTWKTNSSIKDFCTKKFKEPLETNFPKSTRRWSKTNMHSWSNGSVKVICK